MYAPVHGNAKETSSRFMLWCLYFFGDKNFPRSYRIRVESGRMHYEMAKLVAENYQFTLITAPRGFAKTTLIAILWTIYRIVYKLEAFIVIIGKDDSAGKSNLRNIRNELASNQKLIAVYGHLIPKKSTARHNKAKEVDDEHQLTLISGFILRSIGMRGSIRGQVEVYRPTYVIVEDPQSKKHMKEATTLEAHQAFMDHDVEFALDPIYGKITIIGNNMGIGCTVNNYLRDERFFHVNYDIYDSKGHSMWEAMYPTKILKEQEATARRMGKGHVFDAERRNIPDDSLQKKIAGVKFHNVKVARIKGRNFIVSEVYPHPIRVHIGCCIDPAFSNSVSSDFRAKVILAVGKFPVASDRGVYQYRGGIWVLGYEYDHSDPSKIPDWIVAKHREWIFDDVVIEANGAQLIFESMLENHLLDDAFFKLHPFRRHFIKYIKEGKGDRIWNRLTLMCKYGQLFVKHSHVEILDELDKFGYLIRKHGIHLLDALQMGDSNIPVPKEEPDTIQSLVYGDSEYKSTGGNTVSRRTVLREKLKRRGKSWQIW